MKREDLVPAPGLLQEIIAGVITSIVCIVSAMALATLIFTGPLAQYLPQGIGVILLGTVLFAVLSALTAPHPLILSAPQEIPIVILALMAASVAANVSTPMDADQAYRFMLVAMGVTSVLVGLSFLVIGHFKLGKMVRYIPFPVVGGYLAGTGWLIVKFSFTMMTGLDVNLSNILVLLQEDFLYQWVPGVLVAFALLAANRPARHYLAMPGILFGSIVLFYIILYAKGFSFQVMESKGYLLGPFPGKMLFSGFPYEYVAAFDWKLFLVHLPAIVSMMILNAIIVLFNYSGFEIILKEDFNLDKELKKTGYNNILAGLAGAPAGYFSLSKSSIAENLGAKTRVPTIVVALTCLLTMLYGGQIVSMFPKAVLGGLLLNLGLAFLLKWLIDTWGKTQRSDYLVIVLIFIVICTFGFLEGVVIGLLVSSILFVINYSKVEVVKYELTGKTYKSKVERSEHLKKIIEQSGDQILILVLQGFIFFGTAHQIQQRVLTRTKNCTGPSLKYLLFDFQQVTGLDTSAINSFRKLYSKAKQNGFSILLCGLNQEINDQLLAERFIPDPSGIIEIFEDLDHGLEQCEEDIIRSVQQNPGAAAEHAAKNTFQSTIDTLSEYLEERDVPAKTVIIEQGKASGGIYFLVSGQITVYLNAASGNHIRLKTMGPGTLVGEVSLYLDSTATASVVTKTDCRIQYLSKENFEKIHIEAPEKATWIHKYVVKLLSDRLAESNSTIQSLIR